MRRKWANNSPWLWRQNRSTHHRWATTLVIIVGTAGLMGTPMSPSRSTSPVSSTKVPAAAGPVSATPASVRVAKTKSANWSGYEVLGGPYSVITGTFTVPGMSVGTPVGEQASEWMGVGQGATSLIQAGVDEYPNPVNPLDTVAQAWWEVLPARDTNITSVNVDEGDIVRVTIWRLNGTRWDLNLTDETSGGSFTSPPERYNGPANTAEWVVEAPSLCRQKCQPAFLAPYTPDIVFSHLRITGHETSLERITLVQQSDAVATPSPLEGDEFRVAYTGPTAFY